MSLHIVGIRFQKIGKVYHFDAGDYQDLVSGDFAVVETRRGRQLGQVVQILDEKNVKSQAKGRWKPIQRPATPRDLVQQQLWEKKQLEATINCRAKAAEIGLSGIKIVAAEFSFDGRQLTFLYSTEGEESVNLKSLRQAMRRIYNRTKIEMRLIGPRDVAKIIGGMGACGLETRCCSKFLTEFSPISIKMAKAQGVSLNPSEITGMCGRLRCCLIYEYQQYVDARKQLPKRNKRVITPKGEGKVIDTYPLKDSVLVEIEDVGFEEFGRMEIQPWDELEELRRKSQAPCDKHENGECDCQRGVE